jgi:hypothetical protein
MGPKSHISPQASGNRIVDQLSGVDFMSWRPRWFICMRLICMRPNPALGTAAPERTVELVRLGWSAIAAEAGDVAPRDRGNHASGDLAISSSCYGLATQLWTRRTSVSFAQDRGVRQSSFDLLGTSNKPKAQYRRCPRRQPVGISPKLAETPKIPFGNPVGNPARRTSPLWRNRPRTGLHSARESGVFARSIALPSSAHRGSNASFCDGVIRSRRPRTSSSIRSAF